MTAPSPARSQFALALVLLLVAPLAASAAADPIPVTPAETLSGRKISFPTVLGGKPAICIFGFSKEAGDRTKEWMSHFQQDGVEAWSIANLEAAPAFVRGMIRGSMRKDTPPQLLERSLIMTKDERPWKVAVGAKVEKAPVVVVFDAATHIVWSHEGPFDAESYREARSKLSALAAK
jgi:hypothetical protein